MWDAAAVGKLKLLECRRSVRCSGSQICIKWNFQNHEGNYSVYVILLKIKNVPDLMSMKLCKLEFIMHNFLMRCS